MIDVANLRKTFGKVEALKGISFGVRAGENATVASDRGETTIIATVTDRMPEGLVAIPTYVPDARSLMVWTPNAATRWFDVAASGASVRSGS